MRMLLTVCIVLVCWLPSYGQANALSEITDDSLVYLLNNFEMLAYKHDLSVSSMSIRVIRLADQGECGATLESCPKRILYVAVSSFDEAPEQKLFVFPKAYDWKFIRWKNLPKTDKPEDFIVFDVCKQIISPSKPGSWSEEIYEVSVNYRQGSMRKFESDN